MRHVALDTWHRYTWLTLVIVIRRNYNVDPRQHVPRPAGLVMDEDELDKYTAPAPPSASKKVSRYTLSKVSCVFLWKLAFCLQNN